MSSRNAGRMRVQITVSAGLQVGSPQLVPAALGFGSGDSREAGGWAAVGTYTQELCFVVLNHKIAQMPTPTPYTLAAVPRPAPPSSSPGVCACSPPAYPHQPMTCSGLCSSQSLFSAYLSSLLKQAGSFYFGKQGKLAEPPTGHTFTAGILTKYNNVSPDSSLLLFTASRFVSKQSRAGVPAPSSACASSNAPFWEATSRTE